MKPDINIRKIFLMALMEPEYARVDYFKAKQSESIYSEKVFVLKMKEVLEYYVYEIKYKEEQMNMLGNHVYDYKLSLHGETDGEMYGHLGFEELESLGESLNLLIDSWYPAKKDDKNQTKNIQPIHWLKGIESLRLFLQSIKKDGLIESRETEEIIQEHFDVNGKKPSKEPQPIKWLINVNYLAYLIHRLGDEFIINIKGSKHQLTASHFVNSEGGRLNVNSLSSLLSQLNKHATSKDEYLSKIENVIQQVKS